MTMYALTNKEQLRYMQAWIKTYADGTQILQSYNTDVVKRTPNGEYIRLWNSWSVTTSKQVRAWCGENFRDLPFEDGTVEDRRRSPSNTVHGYDVDGSIYTRTREDRYDGAPTSKDQLTLDWYEIYYKTFFNKKIRQLIKGDKEAKLLLETADACAKGKYIKHCNQNNYWKQKVLPEPKNMGGVIAKLYDYNFSKACCTDNNVRVA